MSCYNYFLTFIFFQFWLCGALYAQKELTAKTIEFLELAKQKEVQGDKRQASYYLNEAASQEWERKNYPAAVQFYTRSLTLNEQLNNENGMNGIYNNLGMIYHDMQQYEKALDFFKKNLVGRRAGKDKVSIISSLINISVVHNNLERYAESVQYLQEALAMAREMGDSEQMRSCYGMLAETYEKMGKTKDMLHYFDLYKSFHEKVQGDKTKAQKNELDNAKLIAHTLELEKRNSELELERKEFEIRKKDETINSQTQRQTRLLHSLDKNQLIIRYLQRDSVAKANEVRLQNQHLKDVNAKNEAQRQKSRLIQMMLIVGLSTLAILIGFLFFRYSEKKKTNRQLAYQKAEIEAERQKADKLLFSILPAETAKELKETGQATPKFYEKVTVLFTDFQGFTEIAGKMKPQQIVSDLNFCFSGFDEICQEYGLEKIKTIGDAYMCAGGIPIQDDNNPIQVVKAAKAMLEFMKQWAMMKEIQGEPAWHLRIGIHTGSVVAGVIGSYKFVYDIWGDTVNLANRMESAGEAERINISEATYQCVKEYFDCTYRGKVPAKGKGEIDMYFVEEPKF